MKQLPMFDLNYHYFDDWVKQTNRCICSTYKIAYETGQYIKCKECDGFIIEKDKLHCEAESLLNSPRGLRA